eukprot:g33026.t1
MSVADELEKLELMHEDGRLSDEEFARAKQKVLDGESAASAGGHSSHPEYIRQQTNLWAMILHVSQFGFYAFPIAGVIAPIVIWQIKKDELPEIDRHGRMVINWMISLTIYAVVSGILVLVLIGIVMLIALGIVAVVFPVIGAIKANQGEFWRYPMTITLIATPKNAGAGFPIVRLCAGRPEQVVRRVGLAVVVGFMPGEYLNDFAQRPAALGERFGNRVEVGVGELLERGQQVFARRVEHAANFVDAGNVVVRRAASFEPRDELREAGRRSEYTFRREQLFGNAGVHQLPGDMSPAGTRTPAECRGGIGAFGDRIEQRECAAAASSLTILNTSLTPPFEPSTTELPNEELRLKYRFIDLRRPELQKAMVLRHRLSKLTRDFFDEHQFLEIETPMLGRSTPEGARDYLVPSRVHEGCFYALPQSPQIYKQILMVAGYDRYYQLARCFRDEDLRADRQPEFTQIDIEMAFVERDDVLGTIDGLMARLMKELKGVELQLPLPRYTYHDVMERYGTDKPDLRFGMELVDIGDVAAECEFGVFKNVVGSGGRVRGLNAKGAADKYSRRLLDKDLKDDVGEYGAKGLAYFKVKEGRLDSTIAKFFNDEQQQRIIEKLEGEDGDLLLFVADKPDVTSAALAALRNRLGKELELYDPGEINIAWVVDFPLVSWNDDENRWDAEHHMFCSIHPDDVEYMKTDPGKVRALSYDLIANGYEAASGSIRIHDPKIQQTVFDLLNIDAEEAEARFGFLLEALRYGAPPHGGVALGLDRWVMLFAGDDNIRDVIAFFPLAVLAVWGILLAANMSTAAGSRPNVLFIAADDLRNDLACYGHPGVKTPNLDRLARRGVVFNRAYCQQALCNPSRSSLMTGLRPDTLRIWDLPTHFREVKPDVVTLPQHFKNAGYFTQNIGKIYHNWRQKIQGDPQSWSVPAVMHFNSHGNDKPQLKSGSLPPNLSRAPRCDRRDVPDNAYFDGRIADKAVAALRGIRQKRQPFFLAVGFWKPHLPFNPPKKYWDLYDRDRLPKLTNPQPPKNVPKVALHNGRELMRAANGKLTDRHIAEIRHGYLAGISYLDAQIGKVLDELDRQKLTDNTVIVFWSDHGFHLGEHSLWCKTSNFELDARVPLIIAVPKMKHPGTKTEALAELLDLYPTLVDLCGLKQPAGLEGASLVPVLNDPKTTVKPAAYTQHPRPAYYKGKPKTMGVSVRTPRYRYTEWRDFTSGRVVARELYDHRTDPGENQNVAKTARYATAVEKSKTLLDRAFPRKTSALKK